MRSVFEVCYCGVLLLLVFDFFIQIGGIHIISNNLLKRS